MTPLLHFSVWFTALVGGLVIACILFHLVLMGGSGVWHLMHR